MSIQLYQIRDRYTHS